MEEKEFFEEMVIDNLEKYNVFDIHFIKAFRFFYNNYDFELPEDYKFKLFTVLSDIDKVMKDKKEMQYNLMDLELEEIIKYLNTLKNFINERFTLEKVFNMNEQEAKEYFEEAINNKEYKSKLFTVLSDNDLVTDKDLLIFYNFRAKDLLSYFSTNISVNIRNPFLEKLIEKKDERASNLISDSDLEFFVNSFDIKYIESDLDEIISMDFDE